MKMGRDYRRKKALWKGLQKQAMLSRAKEQSRKRPQTTVISDCETTRSCCFPPSAGSVVPATAHRTKLWLQRERSIELRSCAVGWVGDKLQLAFALARSLFAGDAGRRDTHKLSWRNGFLNQQRYIS